MMKKILSAIGRAFKIDNKKKLIPILSITIAIDLFSVLYGMYFFYKYDNNMLLKICDGLFVMNFFVFLFSYFYRVISINHIRRKTKNLIGPLTPEEVNKFHRVTYVCNYSVMLNIFVNLILFIIYRAI